MFITLKNTIRKKLHLRKSGAGFTLIELLITAAIFSTAALLATTVFSNIQTTQRKIQRQQRVSTDGRYVVETIARSIRTGNINYAQFTNSVVTPNPTSMISTVDQNGQITCYRLNPSTISTDLNYKKVEVATNAPTGCGAGAVWTAFTPDDLQVDALSFFVNPASNPFRPAPRANADCRITSPVISGSTTIKGFDLLLGTCACQVNADCDSNICTPTAAAKYNCTGGPNAGATCNGASDTSTCGSGTCSQMVPDRLICTNPTVQPHVTIYISTTSKNAAPGEGASSSLQTTVVSRLYQ